MLTTRMGRLPLGLGLLLCGVVVASAFLRAEARPRNSGTAAQSQTNDVTVGADNIGGVVTSSKGPEAGVWVIAETMQLPTKFRKIVVTDDQGRYLLPQLPNVTYKVWVRGYGLVDSQPVEAKPGKTLALTTVIAPNAQAAAQFYPADYWYSLLNIPPKSAFPMKDSQVKSQAEYVYDVKRGCGVCHQMGNKATREIEPSLGAFDTPEEAWARRLMSGQDGFRMVNAINRMGTSTVWQCSRTGVLESPPVRFLQLRRGHRASSATWSSRCGISVPTGRSSTT